MNKVSKDMLKCFEGIAVECESGEYVRQMGNDCFMDGNYKQAIIHYTNAIKLKYVVVVVCLPRPMEGMG